MGPTLADLLTKQAELLCELLEFGLSAAEDRQQRIAMYRRLVEVDPNSAKNCTGLGFYMVPDNCGEAIASCRRAIELDPYHWGVLALQFLKLCYEKLQKYEEAIAAHRRVIELDPEDGDACVALAECCLEAGLYEEAEKYIGKADELIPDNKEWHDYSLRLPLYQKQGRWAEVRDLAHQLVKSDVIWDNVEEEAFGLGQLAGHAEAYLEIEAAAAATPPPANAQALLDAIGRRIKELIRTEMDLSREEHALTRTRLLQMQTEQRGHLERILAGIDQTSARQEEADKAYKGILKELRKVAAERQDAVKRYDKQLGTFFGDYWPRLGPVSKAPLATAEMLYQEHGETAGFDWGQVGVGFCRAVECELAEAFLRKLKDYLQGKEHTAKLRAGERRVAVEGIPKLGLGETAALLRDAASGVEQNKIVLCFMEERFAGAKPFLLEELPVLLDRLAPCRNRVAHREPFGRLELEELRKLVMGDLLGTRGLLVGLLALKR